MFDEAVKLIERRAKEGITFINIAYDNIDKIPEIEPFVRIMVTQVDSVTRGPGSSQQGCYRDSGIITLQVFTTKGENLPSAAEVARRIGDVYRGWGSNKLQCQSPRIIRVGEDGTYFRNDVIVPFYYDYIFAQSS